MNFYYLTLKDNWSGGQNKKVDYILCQVIKSKPGFSHSPTEAVNGVQYIKRIADHVNEHIHDPDK